LRVHWIQHVPFEGLGQLRPLLASRASSISATRAWEDAAFPDPHEIDLLVVMGGPMSVHDAADLPWLVAEKRFIGEVLRTRTHVLGICFGAQLVAEALGARVTDMPQKEIGWFSIEAAEGSAVEPWAQILGRGQQVFHWHGESFSLPDQAVALARSEGCQRQAFRWGARVLGLQFHLEISPEGAEQLVEMCADDLESPGPWVQSTAEILARPDRFAHSHEVLEQLLDQFLEA
jgi:GMP synthase-like glutamine amidotransferase